MMPLMGANWGEKNRPLDDGRVTKKGNGLFIIASVGHELFQ
jgi:hypothetical protein